MKTVKLDIKNRLYRLYDEDGKEIDYSCSFSVLKKKWGKDIVLVKD